MAQQSLKSHSTIFNNRTNIVNRTFRNGFTIVQQSFNISQQSLKNRYQTFNNHLTIFQQSFNNHSTIV